MGTDDRPRSEVAGLIEKYDLGSSVGGRMEADWTETTGERSSRRDLADGFDRRLLEAALRDAGECGRWRTRTACSRTTAVIRTDLRQFRDAGEVTLGSFRLLVSVAVLWEECDRRYGVEELLDRGGCDGP